MERLVPSGFRREFVRLVPFSLHPCKCVENHNPQPISCDVHHIHPLSLGGKDVKENEVPLCPTGHDILHRIFNDFKKNGQVTPRGRRNPYLYGLAVKGYNQWKTM